MNKNVIITEENLMSSWLISRGARLLANLVPRVIRETPQAQERGWLYARNAGSGTRWPIVISAANLKTRQSEINVKLDA